MQVKVDINLLGHAVSHGVLSDGLEVVGWEVVQLVCMRVLVLELWLFEFHVIALSQKRGPVDIAVVVTPVVVIAGALAIEAMLVGEGGLHDWLVVFEGVESALWLLIYIVAWDEYLSVR